MERWLLEEFDVKLVEPEGLQLGSFYVPSTELIICMSYHDSNIATPPSVLFARTYHSIVASRPMLHAVGALLPHRYPLAAYRITWIASQIRPLGPPPERTRTSSKGGLAPSHRLQRCLIWQDCIEMASTTHILTDNTLSSLLSEGSVDFPSSPAVTGEVMAGIGRDKDAPVLNRPNVGVWRPDRRNARGAPHLISPNDKRQCQPSFLSGKERRNRVQK